MMSSIAIRSWISRRRCMIDSSSRILRCTAIDRRNAATRTCRWFSSDRGIGKNDGTISADDDDHVVNVDAGWIAPKRPLVGDLGQSHLYVKQEDDDEDLDESVTLQRLEQELERLEAEQTAAPTVTTTNTATAEAVDWLATRRSKLSLSLDATKQSDIMAIKDKTFLSSLEIKTCLESLGGRDVTVAETVPGQGYMLVTAHTNHALRSLADTLVRHLRNRNLHLMGVVGAELGVEGADDPNETWLVVDAGNYVVHLQDQKTRKAVNLEAIWFGTDKLRRVNAEDEEAVEDYVAANPVPDDYNVSVSRDWDETMKELQKQRWTVPHRPVVARPRTRTRVRKRNNR